MNPFQAILTIAIRGYRLVVSPVLSVLAVPFGLGCRFTPTCSQYALDAVKAHGAWRGSWLSIRRVCRCHPWGGSGDDPVPEARTRQQESGDRTRPDSCLLTPDP
ncbi:MAG TPA: membrane protein insertion efficiency factor YidD [Verrucomicrobiae bacterium]|nr:membrane protein insertion efficiency factor YidD [Verrucomicrobiae bacterium]